MSCFPVNGLCFFAEILVTLFTVTELHHNKSVNQKIACYRSYNILILILTSFVKVLALHVGYGYCTQADCWSFLLWECYPTIPLHPSPKIPHSTFCLRSNHSLLWRKALAAFQKADLKSSIVCGMKKSHSSRVPGVNIFWSSLIICELLLWECEFSFCTLAVAATVASLRLVTPVWAQGKQHPAVDLGIAYRDF